MEAVCVDGGCDHDAQAGKELEDAGDGEPFAFLKGEELSQKHKDAQDAEYASEHRAGLHCLEVILWVVWACGKIGVVPFSILEYPPGPYVSADSVSHPPGIVNSSHQEEDDAEDVQDEDASEKDQHDDCVFSGCLSPRV